MKFPLHYRFNAKVRPFSGTFAGPVRYRGVFVVTVEDSAVASKFGNAIFTDEEGEITARSLAEAAFNTVLRTRARITEADVVEHRAPERFFDQSADLNTCWLVSNQPGLSVRLWFEDPEGGF